ncbi:pyruvate dehydrogenase X component [Collybia nuda]|uniref:Pyruvate dehydrogenase X component n=1 Tax=Collybia nuda TaxID=64659 RepID=A0A9P6CMT2_9AGAR|nr:pyruvate dehydrogenase X component [Collybia nuda]
MASVRALNGLVRRALGANHNHRRSIHQTSTRYAITNLEMPAMSPTMTEGGIASWKKKEGEAFSTGDVLLEIETDKATIDVEAQDDGIMGKILLQDGAKNVPVGKIIALLAEEGDDISNLSPPKEEKLTPKESASSSTLHWPEPPKSTETATLQQSHPTTHVSHSRPLFPSVHRLLIEFNITNPEEIKGTGVRGMLTKGDVLAFLGKASSPQGTYKEVPPQEATKAEKKPEIEPLNGPAIRQLIVSSLLKSSLAARNAMPAPKRAPDFDSIIADYLPDLVPTPPKPPPTSSPTPNNSSNYLDGLY